MPRVIAGPGIPFGDYRLIALLGQGGMARVYRAVFDGKMGFEKTVALKLLPPKLTTEPKIIQALINEARLGGRLKHRNIVEAYAFDEVDGTWFMALEYVDGWPLDALLTTCRNQHQWFPPSVAYEVVEAVLRALHYAHGLVDEDGAPVGLVHRDIKPGNVMISRDAEVKLMDFGIAKAQTNLFQTTAVDSTKGTPAYMSPEQVRALPLDGRSDLFSVGALLHELLTLQVAFSGENLAAIVQAILESDPAGPAGQVEPRCPPFVPFVVRLLSRIPEGRFPTAEATLQALATLKPELPPGPTLEQWLAEMAPVLPAARADGDFGASGPPVLLSPTLPSTHTGGDVGASGQPVTTGRGGPPSDPVAVPPPSTTPAPAAAPRMPRAVLALGLLVALLFGALVATVATRSSEPELVLPAGVTRADLLALSQARLLSLSDEATVQQAQAYVDRGRAVVVKEQDRVVTGEFPNGTATRFPPGVRLEHSECSCDAEGVCIHRVITVLSYQAQHVHGESAHPAGEGH